MKITFSKALINIIKVVKLFKLFVYLTTKFPSSSPETMTDPSFEKARDITGELKSKIIAIQFIVSMFQQRTV
jgi:hypothetical protein